MISILYPLILSSGYGIARLLRITPTVHTRIPVCRYIEDISVYGNLAELGGGFDTELGNPGSGVIYSCFSILRKCRTILGRQSLIPGYG